MVQNKSNFVQSVVNSWWASGAASARLLAPVTSPAPIETGIVLRATAVTMSWSLVNSDDGNDDTPRQSLWIEQVAIVTGEGCIEVDQGSNPR